MRSVIISSSFLAALATALPAGGEPKERACSKYALNSGTLVPGNGTVPLYLNAGGPLRETARHASTPAGYAISFIDSVGAIDDAGYLTYHILRTATYDTEQCAALCDQHDGCQAFNIYFARDPMYAQSVDCLDPPAVTNIKCALYGNALKPQSGTNVVQESKDAGGKTVFTKVNVGSNGYNKATHLSHFRNLATPHNRTIHAPSSYITYATPAQRASDAREACARECVALTAAGTNCVLFNVYERVVAGASNGTVCAFFGAVEGVDTATNGGDASVAFRDASAWAVFDWDVYRG